MRSAVMRVSRLGGVKALSSAAAAPVSFGARPACVTTTPKASIAVTAFTGNVFAMLPRVNNDDIPMHAFCTTDVLHDARYGLNLPRVVAAREAAASKGTTPAQAAQLTDELVVSVPRLANALMFRHYAVKTDALGNNPMMAVTFRLFFKPPTSIKTDSLLVKDIAMSLDSTIGAVRDSIVASWQSPGNSRIPDSGFLLYDTQAPAVEFLVGDVPLSADTTVASVFRGAEALQIRMTYPAATVTRPAWLAEVLGSRHLTETVTLNRAATASALPAVPHRFNLPLAYFFIAGVTLVGFFTYVSKRIFPKEDEAKAAAAKAAEATKA